MSPYRFRFGEQRTWLHAAYASSSRDVRGAGTPIRPRPGDGDVGEAVDRKARLHQVNALLTQPLEGVWPYLWLDATYVKVREGRQIISRAVVVNEDGKREVLGVATGPSEAET